MRVTLFYIIKPILVSDSQKHTLDLDEKPVGIITGNQGQKLVLCGGEANGKSNIKATGSLKLLSNDYQSYIKTIQFDSAVLHYEMSPDKKWLWLDTLGGVNNKETVLPKLYRIN